MKIVTLLLLFSALLNYTEQLDLNEIVIIVLSQDDTYHVNLAEDLKQDVIAQATHLKQKPPVLHFSHRDFTHVGGWTVLPLIPAIAALHGNSASWIVFCQEKTRFDLRNLLSTLEKYDQKKEIWLGYALHDQEPTIIHHFVFYEAPHSFSFPNFASGFALSVSLVKSLIPKLYNLQESEMEFAIDASHELATFIWNDAKGVSLVDDESFCIENEPFCASYVVEFNPCDDPVQNDNMLFAVKTCKKYHHDRIPVVKNTWAKYVKNIYFYSEEYNESVPTVNLRIPNTDHGHCGKTLAILHNVADKIRHNTSILWVIITDDDTILSSARLRRLLSCYDSSNNVAIGERYGFRVHGTQGYNYITGGGGMVFSVPLVHRLTSPGICECPSPQSPDDMFLGVCLARLGVNITHSAGFHQARPPDYAVDYLASHEIVSFHKHWMIDPVSVYNRWFLDADLEMSLRNAPTNKHTEL